MRVSDLHLALAVAIFGAFAGAGALAIGDARATELVYEPVNPNFGGNPLNGAYLLNNAQAQNDLEDPDLNNSDAEKSDLERFNELLQRSILNRIAASMSSSLFDTDGNLVPGTLETTDFIIEIVDLGDGILRVTTTDKVTGASSSFQVSSTL